MPPKGKKAGGAKDNKNAEDQREQPLQAVVFCDSFETRFNPFTLEKPRCLLPLGNTPLIEYTLEFLAAAGAEEVYLYCSNHAEAVEEYLSTSEWTKDTAPFPLEVIKSDSRSVGDCMRDLDHKQIIVGDFICVYGDVVANISLAPALAAHRARREKDKKSIMTMVLRESGDIHRAKPPHLRRVFVTDPETGRCVHYEQLRPGESPALDIPGEVLKDHIDLEVREDLTDCGIDICTPEVLAQYTDNFDWQLPRRGFLYGVLKDFETFQLTIHTHIATEGYAGRVKNLQTYDSISKDMISRWTYPLGPEMNILPDQSYMLCKGNVYREKNVKMARSSVVKRNAVLGQATSIGENSTVTNSVIGRRCVIGSGVKIDGAYIWDDAQIGDDTVVEKSVIANGTKIGRRCRIEEGALISYAATISDGMTVSGDRRISTLKRKRGYEKDEIVPVPTDPQVVGAAGAGYHMVLDEEEEDAADAGLVSKMQDLRVDVDDSISSLDSDSDDDFDTRHVRTSSARSDSFASIDSEESGEARHRASDFHKEAVASLVDDLQKDGDAQTMQMELNSLRMANNAEDKQIRRAVAVAFNKRIASMIESEKKSPKDAVAALLPKYKYLIETCVKEETEQAEFLLFLQTDLVHRSQGEKILLFFCNALATGDLVEAEGFERWWEDERSKASDALVKVREETRQLVEVLCVSDDEDDSEEESEDEE